MTAPVVSRSCRYGGSPKPVTSATRCCAKALEGDVDTGKAIPRDYIKATVGFEKPGEATGTPPKSLIRMLGPRGNPRAV